MTDNYCWPALPGRAKAIAAQKAENRRMRELMDNMQTTEPNQYGSYSMQDTFDDLDKMKATKNEAAEMETKISVTSAGGRIGHRSAVRTVADDEAHNTITGALSKVESLNTSIDGIDRIYNKLEQLVCRIEESPGHGEKENMLSRQNVSLAMLMNEGPQVIDGKVTEILDRLERLEGLLY